MNPETLSNWMPYINYGFVVLTSVVLALAGHIILKRWESPSGLVCINYLTVMTCLGGTALFHFTMAGCVNIGLVIFKLSLGLLTLFPVFFYASQIVGGCYGGIVVDNAFWKSTVYGKPRSSYGKAYTLAKDGNVQGAVRQFRAYFDEDPKEASPLFYAAELLTQERFYSDAVNMYTRIMALFEKKEAVWAGACYLLAEVYSLHMGRTEDAKKMLRSLLDHTRQRHLRQMATERIEMLDQRDGTATRVIQENENKTRT